jgi:FkbM family methyltransferase
MSQPDAEQYRARTFGERLARAMPSGGPFAPLRRQLKPLFERWLGGSRGSLRSVLPGGEVVLATPAHRHMSWNAEEYAAFRAAVRPGDVVLEAGTNVGAYTVLFAQWTGPAGRVFAFEPDEAAFAGLQAHLSLNEVADRVVAVRAAIAEREGRLRFASFGSSGISRLAAADEGPGAIVREIAAMSIDAFCADERVTPAVIKIDVEGAELAALRGARATIAKAGARLALFVEMHPGLWPSLGIAADDLRRECEAQGLVAERLDGSADALWSTEGVCLRLRPRA